MVTNPLIASLRDTLVAVALLAAAEAVVCFILLRRLRRLGARLRRAQDAALEAARAAALAAPGGIDADAVLRVLGEGVPPTLDNVYALMERQQAG